MKFVHFQVGNLFNTEQVRQNTESENITSLTHKLWQLIVEHLNGVITESVFFLESIKDEKFVCLVFGFDVFLILFSPKSKLDNI